MFSQFAGNARFVFNDLLRWSQDVYRNRGERVVDRAAMCKRITELRGEHEWLRASHVHTLQEAAGDLIRAYQNWWNPVHHAGPPQFKTKRGPRQSFGFKANVEARSGRVRLPKIGWVKVRGWREIPGEIKTARVVRRASGWYVSLSCIEDIEPLPTGGATIGVDVGLLHFATLSTGEKIANPRHLRRSERKLKRLRRELSRKKLGGANRAKARRRLARHYEHVANMRADFQHKLSIRLVNENQVIGIEDLNVRGMLRNRRLAGSISDAGWSGFLRRLQYKAEWRGRSVVVADRFFPSSKTTNCCGARLGELRLADRKIKCPECGLSWDRDVNAAMNLRNVAVGRTETQTACGATVRPAVPKGRRRVA